MFLKLCISVVLLSIMVSCNEKTVSETSSKDYINKIDDVLGESSSDGGRNVGAISFALGTNGGYVLKEGSVINYSFTNRNTRHLKWLINYQLK